MLSIGVLFRNLCFFCFEGSGFVKFSHRDMALAAIKALNGTFMMRVKLICYLDMYPFSDCALKGSVLIFSPLFRVYVIRVVISH
jgi:RNA recognition motif-containing protein